MPNEGQNVVRSLGAAKKLRLNKKNAGPNWRPPKIGGPVRPHTWNMPKTGTGK